MHDGRVCFEKFWFNESLHKEIKIQCPKPCDETVYSVESLKLTDLMDK
jgi:hypothetical protein